MNPGAQMNAGALVNAGALGYNVPAVVISQPLSNNHRCIT